MLSKNIIFKALKFLDINTVDVVIDKFPQEDINLLIGRWEYGLHGLNNMMYDTDIFWSVRDLNSSNYMTWAVFFNRMTCIDYSLSATLLKSNQLIAVPIGSEAKASEPHASFADGFYLAKITAFPNCFPSVYIVAQQEF